MACALPATLEVSNYLQSDFAAYYKMQRIRPGFMIAITFCNRDIMYSPLTTMRKSRLILCLASKLQNSVCVLGV